MSCLVDSAIKQTINYYKNKIIQYCVYAETISFARNLFLYLNPTDKHIHSYTQRILLSNAFVVKL